MRLSRRSVLRAAVAAGVCGRAFGEAAPRSADLVRSVEQRVIWHGRQGGTTWFHPRTCCVPGERPCVLMTLQSISGSDVYGPVHWSISKDAGVTWSEPEPIAGLGRRPTEGGLEEGVCDVVPEYHAKTGTVLAVGHNVFYRNNRLANPQLARHPVYVVRDRTGRWSEPRVLRWDDSRGSAIYTCGCGQRVTLESGEVLIPMSFGPTGREDRVVATARCSFDGKELAIRDVGPELRNAVKRGLLEPSMALLANRFYVTIRAEDGHGYVAASDDGMRWTGMVPWCWEDGTPLEMSTTQQHWLTHSDALYLVYTRKDASNLKVMRWRSPLYMAMVDRDRLRLVRETERVVVPMSADGAKDAAHVAHLGNFHAGEVSRDESIVTVGETIPAEGYRGDVILSRVRWGKPNRLLEKRA